MSKEQEPGEPWGRLTFVSKDPAEDSDHIYFSKTATNIGRNPKRCDHVINKLFISSIHCAVKLEGLGDNGVPKVTLQDNSRNGIWVNMERIGKGASAPLGNGYTVHFTKPGTTPAGVTPMVYKFELLMDSTHSQSAAKEAQQTHQAQETEEAHAIPVDEMENNSMNTSLAGDETMQLTQQPDEPEVHSPSEKKRKRAGDEPASATAAMQELTSKLQAAEAKARDAERKVEAVTADMQQKLQVKVSSLEHQNMSLMSKLEAATAENLELKMSLAAKDRDLEQQLSNAAKKYKSDLEAERAAKTKEFETKLKESTKQYKQKVEAEHFEQRRDMSEKMAAFAKENEQLQASVVTKDEELGECEDKITTLREKVSGLDEQIVKLKEKEAKLAECEAKIKELIETAKKISAEHDAKVRELEEKISTAKKENTEMVGLLAAAEEKVVAAEEQAARAAIAAVNASEDASERRNLLAAFASFQSELEGYRTQLANREKEAQKKEETSTTATAAVAVTISPPTPTQESFVNEDVPASRSQLTAAFNLFSQIQELSVQGTNLVAGAKPQPLGDLHLLSAASAETAHSTTSVSNTSAPPTRLEAKEVPPKNTQNETILDKAKKDADGGNNVEAAQPKSPPSTKKKWEKKRANKQAAPLSAAIETDAASAIAALATAGESSAKSSPSDASTAVVAGEAPDGDWEMLE